MIDMKQVILDKIEELSNEAATLSERREQHREAIRDIEMRIHQIAGAITAMHSILKETDSETEATNESELQECSEQAGIS